MITNNDAIIEEILNKMSLEELCGQLMDLNVNGKQDIAEFEEMVKRVRPGAIFVTKKNKDEIKAFCDIINIAVNSKNKEEVEKASKKIYDIYRL